ncbi:TPA: flagellar hook protein FlgE [Legionella pneumophila]|uniref:Flagellar hook protein FlgE n=1 Tax=Legionella pneumophila TaxID=446 RepID=A0AAN5R585_LEGPN|nr:flagellar hook protein FlgE [Legionella pneumophila]HAT1972071.1 flagellar hook protein FlgE [Legionella pneumophila]HAT6957775.1 flagellar hook-basal body complex protein [Legionella pneumophila]HBC0463935.1 flagellar hook protein FlgE [Legionella pneumophila]HEN4770526.1 flagellar hook protein FlgE [Legionella pneumophila]
MVFNTALSGIQASTRDLEVIGNNIANSATIGFKGSRAEFADIYSSSAYGSGGNAVGGGVKLSRVHQSFATGTLSTSNNTLDLAVNGSGFFILSDQGARIYTRAGQFKLNNENYIVNANNQRLTGLLTDSNGAITGASGDLRINTANITPRASSNVSVGVNMNSQSKAPNVDWVGGGSPATDTYNNVTSSTIYDSLGNSHVLSMYFIHADSTALAGTPNAASPAGTENQWYVAFQIDNQNVPPNVGAQNTNNLFRANFNSDGSFAGVFDTSNAALPNNLIPLSFNLNNGSSPLNLNIDLSDSTQFGSPFAVQSTYNNGYTTGSLAGLDIDDSGMIYGRYTNGQSLAMGQIQLANFADPESLQNIGNTSWAETTSSGQPLVSAPGSGGLGLINSGRLEESNVDLTGELVKLISAQRNFQANAQTIRTGDAITQTIINIR